MLFCLITHVSVIVRAQIMSTNSTWTDRRFGHVLVGLSPLLHATSVAPHSSNAPIWKSSDVTNTVPNDNWISAFVDLSTDRSDQRDFKVIFLLFSTGFLSIVFFVSFRWSYLVPVQIDLQVLVGSSFLAPTDFLILFKVICFTILCGETTASFPVVQWVISDCGLAAPT